MKSVCQLVQSRVPLSKSHSLMAPSQLPVANVPSSGLKARAPTVLVCACPARCSSLPPSRHTLTSPHLLPAPQYCSLRLVATHPLAPRGEIQTEPPHAAPQSRAPFN